jgi:acyl-CoA synthetase (AMP-forming)/AMP-acid ligase II
LFVDPTDLTVWEWAFEDKRYSPIFRNPPSKLAGFSNAVTGERLDFLQVKEHATYLCTALASQYGLGRDDTVSLFSQNSIWYPVAMFAVLRAGTFAQSIFVSTIKAFRIPDLCLHTVDKIVRR